MNFLGGGSAGRTRPVFGAVALVACSVLAACRAPGPEIPESDPGSYAGQPAAYSEPAEEQGSSLDWTASAATGDSLALPPPGTEPPETDRVHVLKKGDTLFSLARFFYDDESRWRDILEANRDQIQDPNRIFVGQVLRIPY